MAGHSHSSNIWSTKSAQDAKRGKLFTRLAKDIFNAVKIGKSADPELNPILRAAIDRAKSANIPLDKIQNSIDKASGKNKEKNLSQSKIYEALTENGKYILIECETDNPTRSYAEVKLVINRSGLKMLEVGSAIRFFDEVGEIVISYDQNKENLVDKIISTDGIIDYLVEQKSLKLFVMKDLLSSTANKIGEWDKIEIESARLIFQRNYQAHFSIGELADIEDFKSKLFEIPDVIDIWY